MDEKRWWLEEGVIVDLSNNSYSNFDVGYLKTIRLNESYIEALHHNAYNYRLVGIPFDCMPTLTERIEFDKNGSFMYDLGDTLFPRNHIPFPRCPEAWTGKTFKITDELKRLIK